MSRYKITDELINNVKCFYPDCEVFKSFTEPDYIFIRKVIGKSKFYRDDNTFFYQDITSLEKIHVAEAILLGVHPKNPKNNQVKSNGFEYPDEGIKWAFNEIVEFFYKIIKHTKK